MTVQDAYRSFLSAKTPSVVAAAYALESEKDSAILIVEVDAFRYIYFDTTTLGEKETVLKFSEVKTVDYFVEVPEAVAEITERYQLFIKGQRKKIRITCSEYDFEKIKEVWESHSPAE